MNADLKTKPVAAPPDDARMDGAGMDDAGMDDAGMDDAVTPATMTKAAPAAETKPKPRRKGLRVLLMLLVPVVLVAGGAWYWLSGGRYETTDNAYLHAAMQAVASDVSGRVVQTDVADNRSVTKGDILFRLDPRPLELAQSSADAALAGARLNVDQMKAAYDQSLAKQDMARDDVAFRQSEYDRQAALADRGVVTSAVLDESRHALRVSQEELTAAKLASNSALVALGGDPDAPSDNHPNVQAALAATDKAAYNLGLATVRAPADGVIYNADLFRQGQFVAMGTPLFSLVESSNIWIDANFKETQLTHIAPGQSAEVEFDVRPGQRFAATVEAIGAGTGAEFSLLPAQNATGNWVKVTQRVPVRLRLLPGDAPPPLISGASASVTVDTGVTRSLPTLASLPFLN